MIQIFFSENIVHWPTDQSRNATIYLKPNTHTALILPKLDKSSNSKLLIVVTTAMDNLVQRNTIRKYLSNHSKTTIYFLIGHNGNSQSDLQKKIIQESNEHQDIIQEDFMDTYANLTIKSLMAIKFFKKSEVDKIAEIHLQ